MRKLIPSLLSVALAAAACGSSSTPPAAGPDPSPRPTDGSIDLDPDDIRLVGGLLPFASCDDLLAHFRAEATERVGPYGLETGGPILIDDVAFTTADVDAGEDSAGGDGAAREAPATAAQGGDVAYTGTNTQEIGVDEPDLVKTDGRRIVTVVNGKVQVTDVTGPTPVIVGTLTIPDAGWGEELFIAGDKAFVFINDGGGWAVPLPAVGATDAVAPDELAPSGPATRIIELDLVDVEIVQSLRIEGRYLSARAVGDTARVVVTAGPTQLPFVYPSNPQAEQFTIETNRDVIARSELGDWLPDYTIEDAQGTVTSSGQLLDCDRVSHPVEFSGFNTLSVLTFDLTGNLTPGDATAVVADGETVYASEDFLYVATNRWFDPIPLREGNAPIVEDYSTAIHQFSIEGTAAAQYLASGTVPGHLLNQFSLDEHRGNLRVVTTEGAPWTQDGSESAIVILARDGEQLVEIGRVGGLGRGEQVFSARLIGDRGYVVTFRQIDPFYVVDLSDPRNPRVSGELKIPGYSSYLHPIGENLVLGVGQDATDDGRIQGAKASVFDVSDPALPREIGVWTMPDSYSAAESEHRAFLWLEDRKWAVLPLEAWSDQFVGAVVLEITGNGIVEVARISQTPPTEQLQSDCRPIDTEGLGEGNELFWIFQEGGIVQICGPEDTGGYGDLTCESFPIDEARRLAEESGIDTGVLDEVGADDRIEICWPDGNTFGEPILRTLVIEDTLWSVSWNRLQANALGADFRVLHSLPL